MNDQIIVTNIPQDTKQDKRRLYSLINATDTEKLSKAQGLDLIVKDFAIFERTRHDTGETQTVFVMTDEKGTIYGTTAGAVIDTLRRFFSVFEAEDLERIHVSSIRSKAGREYTTINILA